MRSASSANRSIRMARAPSRAAAASATCLSALMNGAAAACGSFSGCVSSSSANGSSPASFGDLGLGAPFRFEGEIDVFEAAFAVGCENCRFQRGVEFALFANRLENRRAALLQFAQIVQSLFQSSELRIVERAGGFLAVSRDERNGRSIIKQGNRSFDLLFTNAEFIGDLL